MLWNIISYFKKNWNIFKRTLNSIQNLQKVQKFCLKDKDAYYNSWPIFRQDEEIFSRCWNFIITIFFFYAIDNADNRTSRRTSAVRDSNLLHQFRSIPPTHQIPSSSKLKFPALNFFHVPPVAHYSFLIARN